MNQLRRQLGKYVGRAVRVHPTGDSQNSLTGMLRREENNNGKRRPGFYLGLMQIPSGKISSTAPRRGVLDIGINPRYFELNKNMANYP